MLGNAIKDSLLFAMMATDSVYFSVFSISKPATPIRIGSVRIPLSGISVVNMDTSQSFVYIDGYDVDVSNPASPVVAGSYKYNSYVDGIASNKEYMYFSDFLGVHILRNFLITSVGAAHNSLIPKRFILEQNYPNPFNSTTTIRYSLSNHSQVRLKIYDIVGREIFTLVDEEQYPGIHSVKWMGNDVSSGLYFYTVEAEHEIAARSMLLIK